MSRRGNMDRASRMAEFRDAHQEWKETKSKEALQRRHEAMFKESPETARRCGEELARVAWEEGQARRDRMAKNKFSGWQPVKETRNG